MAAGIGALLANFAAELVKGVVRRSQSKEAARDEDLLSILDLISTLRRLATEYWVASGPDLGPREVLLRAEIVSSQQHLLDLIAHLFEGDPKRECDVVATHFLMAIGGGDFGNPDREAATERLATIYKYGLEFSHLAKTSRRNMKRSLWA